MLNTYTLEKTRNNKWRKMELQWRRKSRQRKLCEVAQMSVAARLGAASLIHTCTLMSCQASCHSLTPVRLNRATNPRFQTALNHLGISKSRQNVSCNRSYSTGSHPFGCFESPCTVHQELLRVGSPRRRPFACCRSVMR